MACSTGGGVLRRSMLVGVAPEPTERLSVPLLCASRFSPAQKARPVPVRMTTRTSRSSLALTSASVSCRSIGPEMVFMRCGAFSVTVAIGPSTP